MAHVKGSTLLDLQLSFPLSLSLLILLVMSLFPSYIRPSNLPPKHPSLLVLVSFLLLYLYYPLNTLHPSITSFSLPPIPYHSQPLILNR